MRVRVDHLDVVVQLHHRVAPLHGTPRTPAGDPRQLLQYCPRSTRPPPSTGLATTLYPPGMVIVVATTKDDVANVRVRLRAHGVGAVQVVAPSDARRLLLAAVHDEGEAERLAASLRAEGESAVTRPDGGPRLRAWMRDTRPVTFGDRLSVCFVWSEHDRGDPSKLIEIGAGGFGSGQHPSTRLLIEQLLERTRGGERVL